MSVHVPWESSIRVRLVTIGWHWNVWRSMAVGETVKSPSRLVSWQESEGSSIIYRVVFSRDDEGYLESNEMDTKYRVLTPVESTRILMSLLSLTCNSIGIEIDNKDGLKRCYSSNSFFLWDAQSSVGSVVQNEDGSNIVSHDHRDSLTTKISTYPAVGLPIPLISSTLPSTSDRYKRSSRLDVPDAKTAS